MFSKLFGKKPQEKPKALKLWASTWAARLNWIPLNSD